MDMVAVRGKGFGVGAEIDAELEDEGVELSGVGAVEGIRFSGGGVLVRVVTDIGRDCLIVAALGAAEAESPEKGLSGGSCGGGAGFGGGVAGSGALA